MRGAGVLGSPLCLASSLALFLLSSFELESSSKFSNWHGGQFMVGGGMDKAARHCCANCAVYVHNTMTHNNIISSSMIYVSIRVYTFQVYL